MIESKQISKTNIQIIDGDRGKNYPKQSEFYEDGYCLFLNTSNVSREGFDFSKCMFVTKEKDQKLRKGKLQRNDIVLTTRGTVGNLGYFGKSVSFNIIRINSGMVILRSDETEYSTQFLYYIFRSQFMQEQFQLFSSGTAQPQLPIRDFKRISIPIVKLPTQQRIASILSAYDDLIEVNNQRIKLLEQSARELYKEWFVRMRFPGYKEAKFKKGIPEGWEVGKIGDLYDVKSGFAFKGELLGEVGFPIIKITNIQNGNIQLENCDRYSGELNKRIEKFELTEGDLIIAMTGAQIGKVGLVSTLVERYFLNQRAGKFFPKKEFLTNNAFAFFTTNSEYFQTMIENYGMGAAQPNISGEQIEKVNCLIPSDDLIAKFTIICEPIFSMSSALRYQNTQLRQIRDRLLPRLISGKLQVKAEKQEAKIVPLQNNTIQTEENNKAKAYFKRRVLAAYIIDHLKDENTFGHVKLMKLMYLCEHLAKIETASNYHRDAAGPYDNQMIRSIDSQLKKAKWFECVKENQKYTYRALEKKDEYKSWFTTYYAEYEIGIVSLLNIFGKQKTIEAEKVATLYEAYRFLNENKTTFTDKDIINEVLNNWHESKQRISENEWQNCLNWMREKKWIN